VLSARGGIGKNGGGYTASNAARSSRQDAAVIGASDGEWGDGEGETLICG